MTSSSSLENSPFFLPLQAELEGPGLGVAETAEWGVYVCESVAFPIHGFPLYSQL